jgi:hypothetical protein
VVAVQDQKLQNQYLLWKEEELIGKKKTRDTNWTAQKNSIATERNRKSRHQAPVVVD